MTQKLFIAVLALLGLVLTFSFSEEEATPYEQLYKRHLSALAAQQNQLLSLIESTPTIDSASVQTILNKIHQNRRLLKKIDFWLRYFDPNAYKKINGPLPVEWETEVFEKFEKPYKREGAGLTVAEIYLNNNPIDRKKLLDCIRVSSDALTVFSSMPLVENLKNSNVFYFCNRLYLLNLCSVYSTGFECPDPRSVIPELKQMLSDVNELYLSYNQSFPDRKLPSEYLELYQKTIEFVQHQPEDYSRFDHFTFLRDYVNPLFAMNQYYISDYQLISKSNLDYSLNSGAASIFDKSLFFAQKANGIYHRIKDPKVLKEIDSIGKLLFYDPILSGNNERSCASCHKSDQYFTDTSAKTAFQFNHSETLTRNTPSLINTPCNHLIMLDGKLLTLQEQAQTVVTNPLEMGSTEETLLKKILSCPTYKNAFKKFAGYTPADSKVSLKHIYSALTAYYSKFSNYNAPFDDAMNKRRDLDPETVKGFNLFMGKAQCATCHFVPTFSGIKPPYIGNEFEVLGIPVDTSFTALDRDKGRYEVNPAEETLNAFRTTTLRNAERTKPYMHNGVFSSLGQVISFYNRGAGVGHKLQVPNQTATADSLHLSLAERKQLIRFIQSLNEDIVFEKPPLSLPKSKIKNLNTRKIGGTY